MKKKVLKKKVAPKKVVKKTRAPRGPNKVKAQESVTGFKDAILTALSHMLDIAKAQVFDAFRGYIESRIRAEKPAALEDFSAAMSHTLKVTGLTDEDLVTALAPDQRDYLLSSAKRYEQKLSTTLGAQPPAAAQVEATPQKRTRRTKAEMEAANLSLVTKPSGAVVESGQAEKLNADEFGLGQLGESASKAVAATAVIASPSPAKEQSVFASLDVL